MIRQNTENFILVIGDTGGGKSHSLQTLPAPETVIICPENKSLPWIGAMKSYATVYDESNAMVIAKSNFIPIQSMSQMVPVIDVVNARETKKYLAIDTITPAMSNSVIKRTTEEGWKKFNDFMMELEAMISHIKHNCRKDLRFIITAHTEEVEIYKDSSGEATLLRTDFAIPAGKVTKKLLKPASLFTVVLEARCMDTISYGPIHCFDTENSKESVRKSPQGMFPYRYIPNDMAYVWKCIDAFEKGEPIDDIDDGIYKKYKKEYNLREVFNELNK